MKPSLQENELRDLENMEVSQAMESCGVANSGTYDLLRRSIPSSAIPTLLSLMRNVKHPAIKQGVIRALATDTAKGIAGPALIDYFETIDVDEWASNDTKWVIGNTLGILVDCSLTQDMVRLAMDRRHGRAREMIVLALGKLRSNLAFDALMRLLDDPDVCGHAVMALGKFGDGRAIHRLTVIANNAKPWVRTEACKALKRLGE